MVDTITSIEGNANITYTPTILGIVSVTGDCSSDGEYSININQGQLETVKFNASSTINIPDDIRVGKTVNIAGVATDENGNPLANTDLTVTVDGKTYTVKTDKNGRWTHAYKPTQTGNIDASASWTGNSTHIGFTNNKTLNVKKGNIIVTITVTENPDGSITITANATDED